ncbi:MAG: magnesium-translocating P-type ATPase [Chloroflexi bacterium]|nr:magnesium-translocating P-type ATPase [Chloroflexota bacterium]
MPGSTATVGDPADHALRGRGTGRVRTSRADLHGLTSAEAARRLRQCGPNETETGRRFWAVRTFLGFLANPLVLILLAASLISGLLGEAVNAALITLMIVLSVALDFLQVFRSEQAAGKLRALITPTATVWRDGRPTAIPVRDVVPEDVLDLRAGDLIPADARLLTPAPLMVDEAALTGESLPVEKRAGLSPADQLFAGTSIVSGLGQALVTATGGATQFGAIARALVERAPASEFETGSRHFGFLIMRTVLGLVLFVFLVNALLKRDPLESFLFALALAVGLTPEFLPMIITVTLAQGALRMARGQVIVKRLAAIENLGSMDVLCSDKTGTLTQGVVVLQEHVDLQGKDSSAVLQWACVNSALESGVRSPLDAAILAHEHPAIGAFRKRAELPFDFERRRVSVLAEGPQGVQVLAKGAPEGMLPLCAFVDTEHGALAFTPELQRQAHATFERLSRAGYHVLAIARKPTPEQQATLAAADERDLVLSGFAAFLDPPNPTARETIEQLRESGVGIKLLTGDNDLVSRTICEQVGMPTERVVLGDELARMTDDALAVVVERASVFARVSPAQKNRVIRALKRNRHVVGYIGDGINDAPSLHAADVGISVSGGVDVAKAAADIILLERSLAAVYRGVIEGRRSFGNITKYVLMGSSSNFGNMLSMAAASAFLPFLPLLPVQILLNNFLYDLSQLTIPTDNVDASYIARPRRWDTGMVQRFMFGLGPVSSLYDFLTFAVLLGVFHAGPELFRAGWFIESLATQTLVIFVVRTAGSPLRSRPSTALCLSVLGSTLVGIGLALSPLGTIVGFTPVPPAFFGALALLTATYLAIVDRLKRRFYRASGWQ